MVNEDVDAVVVLVELVDDNVGKVVVLDELAKEDEEGVMVV